MVGKLEPQNQRYFFQPLLINFINTQHELVLLAQKIDWNYFEKAFAPLYSKMGQPAMPIRIIVSFILLNQSERLHNHIPEEVLYNPVGMAKGGYIKTTKISTPKNL